MKQSKVYATYGDHDKQMKNGLEVSKSDDELTNLKE